MSAGKDPMLRGNPAPAGFASSVSGWLQVHVTQERMRNPSAAMGITNRLNTIEGVSSYPVSVGDDDPRIRTLSLASPGAPRWTPGSNQVAAIHGAGHKPGSISGISGDVDDLLTGTRLLDALAFAAVLDMHAAQQTELSKVRKGPEAAPSHTLVLKEAEQARDRAEREVRDLTVVVDSIRENLNGERVKRRHLEAILTAAGQIDNVPPAVAKLPAGVKGVRERGEGRYEALLYRAESLNGKQRGVGIYPTVEEAVQARAEALKADAEAKAAKARTTTVPEVSAAGGDDQMTPGQAAIVAETALTS